MCSADHETDNPESLISSNKSSAELEQTFKSTEFAKPTGPKPFPGHIQEPINQSFLVTGMPCKVMP